MRDHIKNITKKLNKVIPKPTPSKTKRSLIRSLQTKITIETLLRDMDISLEEFSKRYNGENDDTRSPSRWKKGTQYLKEGSLQKISSRLNYKSEVYHLPVFKLLEINITRREVKELLNEYIDKNPLNTWKLPDIQYEDYQGPYFAMKNSSDRLYQRGDIHGFMAILILVREAELNKDDTAHEMHIQNAYRAFPSFCRNERFTKHWKELLKALMEIHFNVYHSFRVIQPDINIIKSQIFADKHITLREACPQSPETGRFIEPEVPFTSASFDNA